MKKTYNYFCILSLCLMLCSCGTKIVFQKWKDSGQLSAMLWYTVDHKSKITIPLLVQAEWEDNITQKGRLVLVFLHGGLFGQCHYDNSELICETNSKVPNSKKIVINSAILISTIINNLQGIHTKLPPEWNYAVQPKYNNIHPSTYSFEHKNTKVKLEILETTWQ